MKYTNGESLKSRWENGIICLVLFTPGVMHNPRVMVIKISIKISK